MSQAIALCSQISSY